jgi:phosphomannomutase
MHLPSATLFRAYDVRGIVGKDLSADDFLNIGHAFASHVADTCQCRTPLIVVMRDARASSPTLMEAMVEGMLKAGAHVLDGGVGPTPMCYFATHHLNADGSVMITGSHNPPDHNGAKFMCDGMSLYGDALLHSHGHREEVDMLDEYLFELAKPLESSRALDTLSVAWDAGNGVAGPIAEQLAKGAKASQTLLFTEPDSLFPNHHPDPSVAENMNDLQNAVTRNACALGVAFDGDGDRLGVVDDKGRLVAPDHLLMLLASDVLARKPGSTIIADVKTSDTFFAFVKALGGIPLMWKTGHAHIKTKMREVAASFGGEASGHLFFADDYYGYDDGLYAAARIIRIVAESGKKLSELVDALPTLHASAEFRIDCADDKKFGIVEAVAAELAALNATVSTLDGVRVSTAPGWWLLRASNTQAALVARCEGNSPEATKLLETNLRETLLKQGVRF